jgi:hypothetical protein
VDTISRYVIPLSEVMDLGDAAVGDKATNLAK